MATPMLASTNNLRRRTVKTPLTDSTIRFATAVIELVAPEAPDHVLRPQAVL